MLGELDGEPAPGGAMKSAQEAFDNSLSNDLEATQLRYLERIE
jgi:hypothetical protein